MTGTKLEKLPSLLDRKLYKTGQTRGAAIQEIYQNRVLRNSTVLIPWEYWDECRIPDDGTNEYENGSIVLVNPEWYASNPNADAELAAEGVELGNNAVLLFLKRSQWDHFGLDVGDCLPNGKPFIPPTSRIAPIGGTILARIHSTTAQDAVRGNVGFSEKNLRGAGIRVYEYASSKTIKRARKQLEAYFWLSEGAMDAAIEGGMTRNGAKQRKDSVLASANDEGLLDYRRLEDMRIIDSSHRTICPLCLKRIPAELFFARGQQAEGRETWDITITEVSLFHIDELRVGKLQHRPYNLGWGHHFCNVVAKDAGIDATLSWMTDVLRTNLNAGWTA